MAYPFRDEHPVHRTTWGTWGLLLACTLVFAFAQPKAMQGLTRGLTIADNAAAQIEIRQFEDRWALVPCEVTHNRSMIDGAACGGYPVDDPGAYVEKNVWVPFLTALFLHANLLHLIGNLLFLWVFGRSLEQRIGSAGIVGLFLAGGVAAFLGYVVATPESTAPALGASGAVAAIMGAFLVLQPERRLLSFVYAAGLQVMYVPAWALLGFFFASQFFTAPGSQVAWQAHVVGMVFGIVVAGIWAWRDPSIRPGRDHPIPPAGVGASDASRCPEGWGDGSAPGMPPESSPRDWPTTPPPQPPLPSQRPTAAPSPPPW